MGAAEVIDGLKRVKDSFNSYPLDSLAQAGATAAIQDVAYLDSVRHKIMASRDHLSGQLETLGFKVLPSSTNFLFVMHPAHEGLELANALREEGILVRHFKQPRIDQYLRITVGTPDECELLCKTLVKILAKTH
jgi:histidinol-phosphate aminotransferase